MPQPNFPYGGITRTAPAAIPAGYRLVERRTPLGSGDAVRDAAMAIVLSWGVKTRAGFRVSPMTTAVQVGEEYTITLGPVREPVRVEWVDADGFGYTTQRGHPLSGEEAFRIEQDAAGMVAFVNRSVSRPASLRWRFLSPGLLLAQAFFVRRYGRMLAAAVIASPPGGSPAGSGGVA